MDRRMRFSTSPAVPGAERGIALVVVLWVVALLTVMSMTYSYSTRIEALTVRNALDAMQARYLAETGVQRALWVLAEPTLALRWPADGNNHSIRTEDGMIEISIVDESAFININHAGPDLLDGILRVVGVDSRLRQPIVGAILDWRDPDSIRNASGAEDSDYAAAGLPYGAKDAPFDSVDELNLLLGMSAAVYGKLEPYSTVYGGGSGINAAVAPREVLLANPGTEMDDVESMLAERANTTRETTNAALPSSGVYRISVRAELPSGAQHTLRTIVRVAAGPDPQFTVLSWKENV
jgi:general secretion pathway protein K